MTENRDFLKEFEELRIETDGIRDALVSKTAHFNNLVFGEFDNGIFKAIMGELKDIRKDIKVIDEQYLQIQMKMEENEKKTEKKLSELKHEMVEEMKKLLNEKIGEKYDTKPAATKTPIREAVLGEWRIVGYDNFEGFKNVYDEWTLKGFRQNLKFELVDGKMKQSGTGYDEIIEEDDQDGTKRLFVENDKLKSIWPSGTRDEYYIENGKLHFVEIRKDISMKRIYEKI